MKYTFLIILHIVANACLQALSAQDLDDVRVLIENERYSSAEKLLEAKVSDTDDNPETNYLLVKTYLDQDKTMEAKKFAESHLNPESSDPISQIAYARYLLNAGSKMEAEQIFSSLLSEKKNKRNPELLVRMAEVMIDEETGDAKLALEWLDIASKKDKANASIDVLKGKAYRKLSDGSGAFLAYQNALKKEPDNVLAHYLLGKMFIAQNNPEVYMEHLQAAYDLDSTFAPVLDDLYNHYYYRDIKRAKKYLEKFIANTDYNVRNDYYMTDILYLNKEYERAIQSANRILQREKDRSQPRLFKLMAYSSAGLGDSALALTYIAKYFSKNDPGKNIAADFSLRALLTSRNAGAEKEAIAYYRLAAEMDTVMAEKADYAAKISELYKKLEEYSNQAIWLGKFYQWNEKSNNVDLFNWGIAHYRAGEYLLSDSVFGLYTDRYPDDIYGYYWRAQANAAIDTSMAKALAIPYYLKVVELGVDKKELNKKMLFKAYGYLGGYEANVTKDYERSLLWFEKYLEMDEGNAEISRYVSMLKKWIAEKK